MISEKLDKVLKGCYQEEVAQVMRAFEIASDSLYCQ